MCFSPFLTLLSLHSHHRLRGGQKKPGWLQSRWTLTLQGGEIPQWASAGTGCLVSWCNQDLSEEALCSCAASLICRFSLGSFFFICHTTDLLQCSHIDIKTCVISATTWDLALLNDVSSELTCTRRPRWLYLTWVEQSRASHPGWDETQ